MSYPLYNYARDSGETINLDSAPGITFAAAKASPSAQTTSSNVYEGQNTENDGKKLKSCYQNIGLQNNKKNSPPPTGYTFDLQVSHDKPMKSTAAVRFCPPQKRLL